MIARGVDEDGRIVVPAEAEASRIFDKTHAGDRDGARLILEPVEAAWLVTQDRLRIDGLRLAELLTMPGVESAYLVYCDLRARGLLVRPADGTGLDVWDRGSQPPDRPAGRVHPRLEGDAVDAEGLRAWAAQGAMVGVADEDAAVTYYALGDAEPTGLLPLVEHDPREAAMLSGHVLCQGADLAQEGIGTAHAAGVLLSFLEAAHLQARGILPEGLAVQEVGARRQHAFHEMRPVYDDLRRRGVVARSGLRFGTHLRGYAGRPDEGHARWLVHCMAPGQALHWSEVSRGVRLAHGVKKEFLLAVASEPVRYVRLAWHRP